MSTGEVTGTYKVSTKASPGGEAPVEVAVEPRWDEIAAHAANATLYAGRMPYDPVKSFAPSPTPA